MALKLNPYNTELLEQEINVLFQDVYNKGGGKAIYNIFNHAVKSPKITGLMNEDNKKEGKEPVKFDSFLNTVTRRVLQNCNKMSNTILFLEGTPQRPKVPQDVILNMKLLVYLQVLETRFIYKTIGNCLRILLDEEPDSELYDDMENKPYKKVEDLYMRFKATGKQYECIDKWFNLFDNELRNVIGHNDYYIEKDTLMTSTGMTDIIKRVEDEPRRSTYNADDINLQFNNARAFNEALYNSVMLWKRKESEYTRRTGY